MSASEESVSGIGRAPVPETPPPLRWGGLIPAYKCLAVGFNAKQRRGDRFAIFERT